jgi:alkylation response protein AidB-like acyl-CoA dehydrogenase
MPPMPTELSTLPLAAMHAHQLRERVEESAMPRLDREQPTNAIWEGAGNIQCLAVVRATAKEP